jgi:hypothetical protein
MTAAYSPPKAWETASWFSDPTESNYTKQKVMQYTNSINEWEQDFCSNDEMVTIIEEFTQWN